jgi:hypothetical protein
MSGARWRARGASGGGWCKRPEPRREGEKGMRTAVALTIAALVIGALVSSCATGGPPTPTATPCALVDRCRNPGLTTGGGF